MKPSDLTPSLEPDDEALVALAAHPLYDRRHPEEEALLTTLLQVSEQIAPAFLSPQRVRTRATHATTSSSDEEGTGNAGELASLLTALAHHLSGNQGLQTLSQQAVEALGESGGLRMLFRGLFPDAGTSQPLKNFPRLTATEVEVLEQAALGLSNKEVAKRLTHLGHPMESRTVGKHMENIRAKFQVESRGEAILQGIGQGYLEYDLLEMMQQRVARSHRYPLLFQNLCGALMGDGHRAESDGARSLAAFGLLLMVVGNTVARQIHGDTLDSATRHGGVCAISETGMAGPVFGSEVLHSAISIAQAPPQAARQGFAPGNLFVSHELRPQQGMNRVAISEFTPDGAFVRTFCGGNDIRTRLIGPSSLIFAPDGRLLVGSGWLTDAILAFWEGGNRVERFAENTFDHLAVGPQGRIYGLTRNAFLSWVQIFEPRGKRRIALPCRLPWVYEVVGVTSREEYLVSYRRDRQGVIRLCAPAGETRLEWEPPGFRTGEFVVDACDRVIVPCIGTGDVKVYRLDGALERHYDLGGRLLPQSVTVQDDGRMWVCGRLPD